MVSAGASVRTSSRSRIFEYLPIHFTDNKQRCLRQLLECQKDGRQSGTVSCATVSMFHLSPFLTSQSAEESAWYFYHCRTKQSQWDIPGQDVEPKISGCGLFRFLNSLKKSKARQVEQVALPSSKTLETIAKMDRDMNDEEIAMVLQHEEYSQDLSGRRHSFDQHWLDTNQYYTSQQDEIAPSRPSAGSRPIRANMISGASHATISEGDVHPGAGKPECGICMDDDDWRADWTWLECAHQFHTKCVEDWLKTAARCPVCRTECHVMV